MWQIFNLIMTVIAGIGLGSIISVWLGHRWEKKKLTFQTKLDLYSNFIQSYQDSVAKPKDEVLRQFFVANQKKLELIAPEEIREISRIFYNITPNEGPSIRDRLVESMRKDLESL